VDGRPFVGWGRLPSLIATHHQPTTLGIVARQEELAHGKRRRDVHREPHQELESDYQKKTPNHPNFLPFTISNDFHS
jgi:hypothetical protein